jgi:hypothetical protein
MTDKTKPHGRVRTLLQGFPLSMRVVSGAKRKHDVWVFAKGSSLDELPFLIDYMNWAVVI